MKRITIYCHNEDTDSLRPLRDRLEKKGAFVRFHSVKYDETTNTDQVLTLPRYYDRVKKLYEGTSIPVTPITDDVVDTTDFRDPVSGVVDGPVTLSVGEPKLEPEIVPEPDPVVIVPEPQVVAESEVALESEAVAEVVPEPEVVAGDDTVSEKPRRRVKTDAPAETNETEE